MFLFIAPFDNHGGATHQVRVVVQWCPVIEGSYLLPDGGVLRLNIEINIKLFSII